MIRTTMLAAAALLLSVSPTSAFAQSQAELDARYDRALAAGYKALMLCSAIANAEANGATRSPDSVFAWELAGIQAPQNQYIGDLPYWIARTPDGVTDHVAVAWADDMPARIAAYSDGQGCSVLPIGFDVQVEAAPALAAEPANGEQAKAMAVTGDVPDSLEPVFEAAFTPAYGSDARTTAVIVAGPQGDEYWRYAEDFGPATPQRTWSVAKSIAATVVGAAVQRGDVAVDQLADIEQWQGAGDPRGQITLDALLRMSSGLYSDTPGNRTDAIYFGGSIVGQRAISWPLLHPSYGPGNAGVFRYSNNDILLAMLAIGDTFADHPPAELFERLGMHHTVAETDWQGNYILSSQVWATAPDLMRLGQLYLNDGTAPDGTRILPEGWVEYVSTPSGPQPDGALGYGAGWWLINNSEGVPPDTFAAFGNRGQYIVVVPSREVVIVRRGEDPAGGSGFDIVGFTRDVLAAMDN